MLFIDSETYPIQDGLIIPQVVCFQFWRRGDAEARILLADAGCDEIEAALDSGEVLGFHNAPFDLAVACAHRPRLLPKVYRHYERGLVRCTKVRQKIIDIEAGCDGKKKLVLRNGEWVKADYSLAGNPEMSGSKGLVYLHLGKDRSADKGSESYRLRYGELDGIPPELWPLDAQRYAKEDVVDTGEVFYAQGPEVLVDECNQVESDWDLYLMSAWGTRSKKDDVEFLETWAKAEWKKTQEKMLAQGLFRIEPLSAEDKRKNREPDCLMTREVKRGKKVIVQEGVPAKYVKNTDLIRQRTQDAFGTLGIKPKLTPTGEIKTDADALEQTGDPLLMELADVGPVSTVLKTFLPTLRLGTEVPINTRFNVLLETGRISSSKPNLNNLPRSVWSDAEKKELREQYRTTRDPYFLRLLTMGVRECFVPRPGFYFASVDYDCAELRSLAQVCLWLFGRSSMAEFFQADPHGDPHLALAASILNISLEEAKARKKAGDAEIKGIRQMCKAVNFGLPGGLGPDKLVDSARKGYGVIMTRDEAVRRKAQWFARWPEMRDYLAEINRRAGMGGVTIMQLCPGLGPHRRRGNVGYNDAANGWFQGLTADGAKEALRRVSRECYVDSGTALYGSRPIAFLYDEIIAEVPIDIAHEASERLTQVMVEGMSAWLPDVPVTASPALMECWLKGAEAVYDNNERLVPWVPEAELLTAA